MSFVLEYVIILSCWAVIWSVDVTNEKCLWRDNSLLDHYYGCCYNRWMLLHVRCSAMPHLFKVSVSLRSWVSIWIAMGSIILILHMFISTLDIDSIQWQYVLDVIDTECDLLTSKLRIFFPLNVARGSHVYF